MDFDGRKNLGIPNSEIHDFIKNKINDKYLYDSEIVKKFVTTYFEWIKSSTLNNLKGIEDFNQLSFSSGTSQSFDFFLHLTKIAECAVSKEIFFIISYHGGIITKIGNF